MNSCLGKPKQCRFLKLCNNSVNKMERKADPSNLIQVIFESNHLYVIRRSKIAALFLTAQFSFQFFLSLATIALLLCKRLSSNSYSLRKIWYFEP